MYSCTRVNRGAAITRLDPIALTPPIRTPAS